MNESKFSSEAEEAYQSGNFKTAKNLYMQELKTNPDAYIYLRLAQCHFMFKEYSEAVLMCEKALELEPDSAKGYAMLSKIHLYQKQVLEAEIEAEKAIMLDDTLPDAYLSFAHVKVIQGDYCVAEENIRFVLKQDSNEWFAHYLLAATYSRMDKKK